MAQYLLSIAAAIQINMQMALHIIAFFFLCSDSELNKLHVLHNQCFLYSHANCNTAYD